MEMAFGIFLCALTIGVVVVLPVCMVEDLWNGSLWNKRQRYLHGKSALPTAVPVTFQQFKTYYDLNPNEYHDIDIDDINGTYGRIGYHRMPTSAWMFHDYEYEHTLVFQSFGDYLQYVRFLKEKEREKQRKASEEKRMASMKNAAEYYKAVIRDIERLKAQAESERQDAVDTVQAVADLQNKTGVRKGFVREGCDKDGRRVLEFVQTE